MFGDRFWISLLLRSRRSSVKKTFSEERIPVVAGLKKSQ
jgi:hypothetical protein